MTVHAGGCHCGALRLEYESAAPLAPRACQCSFCRERGARWVSDPSGAAKLTLGADAVRYRFGTGTADFLICGRCGSCLAAVQEIDGGLYAVLNLNAFDDPHEALESEATVFDGETADTRTARRRARWTPSRVVEG